MRLTMWQILCMVYVSWDRQGWDYLKLNLQLNDNLAPIQHFRGCECGVYRQCLRSILEKNTFWRTHCRIYKSATIRNIHVFVLLLQIKNPMIGFTVKS